MGNYDQKPLYQAIANGSSLVTSVAYRLGWTTAPSSAEQTLIRGWLNDTLKVIARRHDWSALVRADSSLMAVKDVYKYLLPPHVMKVINARLIDDTAYVLDDCETVWTKVDAAIEAVAQNPIDKSGLSASIRRSGRSSMKFVVDSSAILSTGDQIGYSELKSGSITAFSDGSSDRTTIASASHGLSNGDRITITGSTNYDGTYTVINSATTFDIVKTYTAETPSSVSWYRSEVALDLSAIQTGSVGFWIYTDREYTTTTYGLETSDIEVVITEDALGAKTTNYVQVPNTLIPPFQWTYVKVSGLDFTSVDSLNSIGLFWTGTAPASGETDFSIYIDGIHVYKESYGGQSWPLKIVQAKTLDRAIPNVDYLGAYRPNVMTVSGLEDRARSFELFRKPDANYPIWMRYVVWPSEFAAIGSNDSAVCDIPDIDDVLIFGATWLGLSATRDWNSAGHTQADFRRALKEASDADEDIDGWEPVMGQENISFSFGLLAEAPAETAFGERGSTSGFFYLE